MTYPIHPGPFFRAASNWGKPAKHSLFLRTFSNWTDVLLSALLIAAASRIHEESHLINGPLESSLLDEGFPVEYELDEFNTPHTETTLSPPPTLATSTATQNSLRRPATSSLGNIFWRHSHFSPQTTRVTHSWTTTRFLSLTSKHDFCNTMATIYHSHIQPCLNRNPAHFAQAFSCKNSFPTL